MVEPTVFWTVAIGAMIVLGITKSGFVGGALITTPLLAMIMPVAEAAALMLPILLIIDISNLRHYRHDYDRQIFRLLLPAALVGVAVGGLFFSVFADNDRILKLGVGLLGTGFLLYQGWRSRQQGAQDTYRMPDWAGRMLGAAGGFTSTLAHAGGPPFMVYLAPQQLQPPVFVGTIAYLFFFVNLFKLIPYGLLGLLQIGNVRNTLLLLPAVLAGIVFGHWLNGRISHAAFQLFLYVVIALMSVQLIIGRNLLDFLL